MIWTPSKRLWKPADRRGLMAFGLSGCCCCECEACLDCNYPDQMQVEISGVTNDSCTDCANMNATWVCDVRDPPCALAGGFGMAVGSHRGTWNGEFDDPDVCSNFGHNGIGVNVFVWWDAGTSKRQVVVTAGSISSSSLMRWILTQTSQSDAFDCTSFSELSLSPDGDQGFCEHPSSTCLVSAL